MILDFEPRNGNYIIRAPQQRAKEMVNEYGLDFWPAASTAREGVFSTIQPYAAAPFWEYANERAKSDATLRTICREIEASRAVSGGHFDVPEDQELSDYQNADLSYMLRRSGKVLDADQPGLGKTMTAIVYANEIRAKRVLIDCPAQIRYQWLDKWQDWSTMQRYLPAGAPSHSYPIISSRYGVPDDAAVTVVSLGLAAADGIWEALMRQQFDLLIIDEAHYLKTMAAARTKAIFGGQLYKKDHEGRRYLARDYGAGLASRCRHIVELTGTPLPNRPLEAYVHSRFLCHEAIDFLSEHAFKERFNPVIVRDVRVKDPETGISVWKKYTDEQSGRHAELQARMRANFMCRHLKRDVLSQLKLPRYSLVRAEATKAVKDALHAESLLGIDPELLSGADIPILGPVAAARRMMGVALAPQAAEYAKLLLWSGVDKLVVFYWHIEVGDFLQKALHSFGVCRVDGSSSAVLRDREKHRFIREPGYRIMMGNLLSLGTGTDGLQDVASYALLAEPDWVPGVNEQCVDRLDRRGQRQTVNADIFVAPGSIAEKVLAAALRKRKVTHNALDRVF